VPISINNRCHIVPPDLLIYSLRHCFIVVMSK
jgi:hypothetical protein